MRFGLINSFDLQKPVNWPKGRLGFWGNARTIVTHLELEGCEMEYLGPLQRKRRLSSGLKRAAYRLLQDKRFYSWADPKRGAGYLQDLRSKVLASDADVLLCLEHAAIVAGLEPDRPLVLWTDACLGCQIDFFPYLSNLCRETREAILSMEQQVIDRCDRFIVASEWARREVLRLYQANPEKIQVIPRGAKIEGARSRSEVEERVASRTLSPCRLLFIGVDWKRKGGDMALAVVKELNKRGRPAELSIVGCEPDTEETIPDYVRCYGTVDRSTEEGSARFKGLIRESDFTILPTLSDIVPGGICEPFAFGVPSLSTRVGGVPDLVEDGSTGCLFDLEAGPEAWCDAVEELIDDRSRYQAMALAAFSAYDERFNWAAVARSGLEILRPLVGDGDGQLPAAVTGC